MKIRTLSVKEVNEYAGKLLNYDPILNNIIVAGEISNFVAHSSGHAYFSLKDDEARISCVMFSRYFNEIDFKLKNGDKVNCQGDISIYVRDGKFQLYVHQIERSGLGDLHLKFEALKEKYKKLGYFDTKYKKQLPKFPKRIGIITSDKGAAIKDIISVFNRRSSLIKSLIIPVNVQGEKAKDDISSAIQYCNDKDLVDLIILSRGGGSLEDLWAFNEPIVVESVFHSTIPIISGVGHETDFTLVDFVSDLRAPTPSAAAEVAIIKDEEISYELKVLKNRLIEKYSRDIRRYQKRLEKINPVHLINQEKTKIKTRYQRLDNIHLRLSQLMSDIISLKRNKLEEAVLNLNHNNPLSILKKGYSVTLDTEDQLIKSVKSINQGDEIKTQLKDGSIISKVLKVGENSHE